MRLQDNIDFTTLTWVKPELDETLKQARNALQNIAFYPARLALHTDPAFAPADTTWWIAFRWA